MKRTATSGKGQVFSLDVLFSLLPVMMIIGASLQYLYLAEEQSTALIEGARLETLAQAMAENVAAQDGKYVRTENCSKLETALSSAAQDFLPDGYVYHVQAYSYYDYGNPDVGFPPTRLCSGSDDKLWSSGLTPDSFNQVNNAASSDQRFMLEYNTSGNLMPGHIAGVSFTIWKNN